MTRAACLVVMASALALLGGPARAQDKKLPTVAEVLGKLKQKRDRGGEPSYKFELETEFYNKGQVTRTCRAVYDEFRIDWTSGKFRLAGWDACPSPPFEIIKVYDGEKIKTQFRDVTTEGKPTGDGAWKYGMVTGRLNSGVFQTQYWPVFFHKGCIAGLDDRFYPGHFVFDPDPEEFFVHAEFDRGGRKCISLRTFPQNPAGPMQYEYIIDPGKEYSVVAFTYFQKNLPTLTLETELVEAKQRGRWNVRGWTFAAYSGKRHVEQVIKATVTGFTDGPPAGNSHPYDLVAPDGAKVGRTHYELPDGKQDLKIDLYAYEVQDGKLNQISGPRRSVVDRLRDHWHWYALAVGLAVASVVGFRLRRGWRGTPAGPAGGS